MFPQDLDVFSFSTWYPKFAHLTFDSRIIHLSESILAYLGEDGIQMPAGLEQQTSNDARTDEDDIEVEPATDWTSEDDEAESDSFSWLPDLKISVGRAIDELGGEVIPKLNWSAPKDASWILPNRQIKCTCLSDVLLLLKASTFVSYDVMKLSNSVNGKANFIYGLLAHLVPRTPYDTFCFLTEKVVKTVPQLVLRKWVDINPGWEFRCFVRGNDMIGITQRYSSAFYPHVAEDQQRITSNVKTFFQRKIRAKFPIEDFIFDIILCGDTPLDIRLVDFNPFSRITDPVLFTWEELSSTFIVGDELMWIVSYVNEKIVF